MRYCKYCGAQLKDGVRFCSSCGRDVSEAAGVHPMASGMQMSTPGGQQSAGAGQGPKKKKGTGWLILLIILLLLGAAGTCCYLMRDTIFPDGLPFLASFEEKKKTEDDEEDEPRKKKRSSEKDDDEVTEEEETEAEETAPKKAEAAEAAKEAPEATPETLPAATEAAAVAAAEPAVMEVPAYGPLEHQGWCEDVDGLAAEIIGMRRRASEYITDETDYLITGDGDDRKVIYCRIIEGDDMLRDLMKEYGYSDYIVEYYFDNNLDGMGSVICAGPDYALLHIGKKDYEYYFAANQLIRRISEDGTQDNPVTNDFIAGIYSAGYDFAQSILNGYGEYIIPDSDRRRITADELDGMSAYSLKLARNEIYARHGRRFADAQLQSYFDSKSWYSGTIEPDDFSEDLLNQIEKDNVKLIKKFEK